VEEAIEVSQKASTAGDRKGRWVSTAGFDAVHQPKTARGKRTRERILTTAAVLFHDRGVHATSVDDVLAASGTGKSQFYHHFSSKTELVREVLGYQFHRLQEEQAPLLERLDTWDGFVAWFDYIVRWQEGRGLLGGCPVGSLAAEMADWDDDLRADLADAFRRWESVVAGGLRAMRDRGELRPDADPDTLAEAVVAAIQGGILLARTKKDVRSLEHVLASALAYLRGFQPAPARRRPPSRATTNPAPPRTPRTR